MRPLSPHRRGEGYKSRNKPQPPPDFQPNQELTSLDESATLMKVTQMLGTLTTVLVRMATKMEQLSQGKASQVAPMSAQPGTRVGGNPPATSSQLSPMSAQPGTRAGGNPLPPPHRCLSCQSSLGPLPPLVPPSTST